jgi:hypothetical protein
LLLESFSAASFLARNLAISVLKVSNFWFAYFETVLPNSLAVRGVFAAFTASLLH